MGEWLRANAGTVFVCLVLCAIVIAAVAVLKRDKKKGKSACCGSCGKCPGRELCHKPYGEVVRSNK
ncbi:MAG: FeoB-associated Cys-rich membrane protein [Eubacteriaceae bacterium]|nr:FeoB-associated Cys-rich membrane protein [Eubacteriaceae bacterium]